MAAVVTARIYSQAQVTAKSAEIWGRDLTLSEWEAAALCDSLLPLTAATYCWGDRGSKEALVTYGARDHKTIKDYADVFF